MLLVLLRHGIAQDRVEGGVDADRRLTPKGLRRTREAVQGLRALGVAPRVVLSSPYRRARETAELALEALGPRGVEVVPTDALLPDAPPADLLRVLERLAVDHALAAGHAPHLDALLAHVLGAPGYVTSLRKAGAACVELVPGPGPRGRLVWLIEPRALRRLGRA